MFSKRAFSFIVMGLMSASCTPTSPPQKPKRPSVADAQETITGCAGLGCIKRGEVCCESANSMYCTSSEETCARPDPPEETWFYSCLSPADCQGDPCAGATGFRGFSCVGKEV